MDLTALETADLLAERERLRKYSDDEPRDDHGRWTDGGSSEGRTHGDEVRERLGLTGRIRSRGRYDYEVTGPKPRSTHYGLSQAGIGGQDVIRVRQKDSLDEAMSIWEASHPEREIANWRPWGDKTWPVKAEKRARLIRLKSGGPARDRALNPIIARLKRDLIALADEHGNRVNKYSPDQPRDDHGRWTDGGGFDLQDVGEAGRAYADAAQRLYGDAPRDPYAPITAANELEKSVDRGALKAAVAANLAIATGMTLAEANARIAEWARTTGDSEKAALDMQAAAKAEFALKETTDPWHHAGLTPSVTDEDRSFLRAMYIATQQDLAARGIDGLYLYRGTRFDGEAGSGHAGQVQLQPLSSWSINAGTAMDFSTNDDRPVSRLDAMYVPSSQIVATPRTGFGAAPEGEVVVLGGMHDTRTTSWPNAGASDFGGGYDQTELEHLHDLLGKAAERSPVARLDEDLRNADWAKRTWDVHLPASEVPPINPHLPVYRVAPPGYRSPMVKYSPDQPRDENGRWTDGGGDADMRRTDAHGFGMPTIGRHTWSRLAPMDPKEFRTEYRGHLYAKNNELGESGRIALAQVAALNKMLSVPGLQNGPNITVKPTGYGEVANSRGAAINLGRDYYGAGKGPILGDDSGFHPEGTTTAEGYVAHEYGHAVDWFLMRNDSTGSSIASSRGWGKEAEQAYTDWRQFAVENPVSAYANTNAREAVAEAFTAAYSATSKATDEPAAVALRDLFQKYGVTK